MARPKSDRRCLCGCGKPVRGNLRWGEEPACREAQAKVWHERKQARQRAERASTRRKHERPLLADIQLEREPQYVCKACWGLAHRRAPDGCPPAPIGCGRAYAPEVAKPVAVQTESVLSRAGLWA